MNVDDMKIGDIKKILEMFGGTKTEGCPFKPGEKWFIRTVTNHMLGRVRAVIGGFIVLDGSSWVADSGRYSTAFESGEDSLSEVEVVPDGTLVALGAITDATPWEHELVTETK